MKKILVSLLTVGVVAGAAIAGTSAYFSDSEVSRDNVLQAGDIDLMIDNTSFYNGFGEPNEAGVQQMVFNPDTSWLKKDLGTGDLFFNFLDLKPGDMGEDTISIHVGSNDAWVCADVKLTDDSDQSCTEPENDDDPTCTDPNGDGELAEAVNFMWWADDGDNVFETCEDETVVIVGDNPETQEVETEYTIPCVSERLLPAGPLGNLNVGQTATVAIADSETNIWGEDGPIPGNETVYVGKAWCFGAMAANAVEQDGLGYTGTEDDGEPTPGTNGPDTRGAGFRCDGSEEDNAAQTDKLMADIQFRAVQARHNMRYECGNGIVEEEPSPTSIPTVLPE